MRFSAENLLSALLEATPRPTLEAPRDARGLYGLVDHHGDLRYIGSTSSDAETLYKRIHQRHRTGSEEYEPLLLGHVQHRPDVARPHGCADQSGW
jgi:DNA polymerase-3 subunit epsilon